MLVDGPVRMITQGQELSVDVDEKTLVEMQFKDSQVATRNLRGKFSTGMSCQTAGITVGVGIKLVTVLQDGNLIAKNPMLAVGRILAFCWLSWQFAGSSQCIWWQVLDLEFWFFWQDIIAFVREQLCWFIQCYTYHLTLPYLTSGVGRLLNLLRPYQFGPMRIPECKHKVTGNGYKAVNGCEAVNKRLWSRNQRKSTGNM